MTMPAVAGTVTAVGMAIVIGDAIAAGAVIVTGTMIAAGIVAIGAAPIMAGAARVAGPNGAGTTVCVSAAEAVTPFRAAVAAAARFSKSRMLSIA